MKMRVVIDEHVYEVEVTDLKARPVIAVVNGQPVEVWPEQEESAIPLQVAPTPAVISAPPAVKKDGDGTNGSADKSKMLLAPIPGVIIEVRVKEGDSVTAGQELFILEAMKMKNSIRASRAGAVSAVRVSQGEQVRKDQVLIVYAD